MSVNNHAVLTAFQEINMQPTFPNFDNENSTLLPISQQIRLLLCLNLGSEYNSDNGNYRKQR
jgi:hypothetical protein